MISPISDLEQRILLEQDGLLILNKPYDIPTSGKSLDDPDAVQFWLMKRNDSMVWAVHQLDADTTGVNIFVSQKKLVGRFQKALADPDSVKKYIAVVHGEPLWDEQHCDASIGYVDQRSLGVTEKGKSAHSKFRVLQRNCGYSLIEAEIFTGRTHQIRIHLSHLGFPIVGEEWYCQPPCVEHPRQALHAFQVNLGNSVNHIFSAPLPDDIKKLCLRLGLDYTTLL